ncbi:uncharacterized protein TRIADDRAFT_53580 [Trichoplax adhaerens]|uniref:Ras suppressor protein 1 n=1 Tax=Trichoplax adhaerens TaxID=10228 RepID=B3RPL2_TRIAD|nr:hypothetical protein TRIADDRAFT_53580 [Trichoplax adhaerens]EDV28210.1 hypothetical protein TRIADDRAFT_53580 [Trichoplax adhaerens]|eukprot:XP_002110044.1 hypothetical protein TRIADDRAFT_53580 [Trichoplax adhaerens]
MAGSYKNVKKLLEEAKVKGHKELDLCDRGLINLTDLPTWNRLRHLTTLTLSHNKISAIPPAISDLSNLECLILCNNAIQFFPTFNLATLRALYLGDNEIENVPPEFGKLKSLQILVLRDNYAISLPNEIGNLSDLKELHLQGNRLTVLPPALADLGLNISNGVIRLSENPYVKPIASQLANGIDKLMEYLKSDTYKYLYSRHLQQAATDIPPKIELDHKLSRSQKKIKSI